jgi:serine/threonine-protein kinase RIO1
MNKAFDDLIYHSGLIADGCWEELDTYTQEAIERLIELTVLECVQACINEGKTYEIESAGEYSSNLYATAIKKHFGVEE